MKITISALFVSLFLISCTTMKAVENAEGTGLKKEFTVNYDTVWNTTVSVIKDLPLTIEKNNKEEGQILARRGASLISWGENVGVFVKKVSKNSTTVEVVSKRVVTPNVIAKDWSKVIIEKLSENLPSAK